MNNQTNFASKATDRTTDTWLTPRHILDALMPFDLDPCAAPDPAIWPTAANHFTIGDSASGLDREWAGRVWLNPPYKTAFKWIPKLAEHGNGIALIFARTETRGFFEHVWNRAHALLFLKGRLSFHLADGSKGGTAGAPSVLVAYGENNSKVLDVAQMCGGRYNGIKGKYIKLK